MHTYQRRWPDNASAWTSPSFDNFCFNNALDVARYSEFEPLVPWRTWPEVWHLDGDGAWRCGSRGSSIDSVRTFALDPTDMLRCRDVRLGQSCPGRWLVIEPRHPWLGDRYRPREDDAEAFLTLRKGLALHGVSLLDVLVFDQEFHWWSLHEMTSGTTKWR